MARPKEFDRDEALGSAIAIFCEHGFEGTSTEVLLRAMNISRQSMYDTFGDKRRLYLEALQHYVADSVSEQIRALNSAPSAIGGIEAALDVLAVKAAAQPASGCMGIAATCEFGVSDKEISILIDTAGRTLLSTLERRIAEAKGKGEIGESVDDRAAARFIHATFTGIRVAARGGAGLEFLRDISRMAVRSLK
jgi:TetR/AcrR family transcriptional regulator, transcriptional repressor for nem operon